jgi:hypothetical protein
MSAEASIEPYLKQISLLAQPHRFYDARWHHNSEYVAHVEMLNKGSGLESTTIAQV